MIIDNITVFIIELYNTKQNVAIIINISNILYVWYDLVLKIFHTLKSSSYYRTKQYKG